MASLATHLSARQRALARVQSLERRVRGFEALPEDERRVLAIVAIFPCSVWRHTVIQMSELVSLRTSSRALENSRLDQLAKKWADSDLVRLEGSEIRCDPDLGAYLVRLIAETPFGHSIRHSIKANVSWWKSVGSAADTCAYETRLLRLAEKTSEARECAANFLSLRGQSSRVAVLFGPGDPSFVPGQVRDWHELLPLALEAEARALVDLAWEMELFDTLTDTTRNERDRDSLLLLDDRERHARVWDSISSDELERGSAYRSLWYTWQLLQGRTAAVREAARTQLAAGVTDVEAYLAVVELSRASLDSCIERFARACVSAKRNKLSAAQMSWVGVLRLLCLGASESPEHALACRELLQKSLGKRTCHSDEPAALLRLADFVSWRNGAAAVANNASQALQDSPISVLVGLILLVWQRLDPARCSELIARGQRLREVAHTLSHQWLADQLDAALRRLQATHSGVLLAETPPTSTALVDLVLPKPEWELTLESLGRIVDSVLPAPPKPTSSVEPTTRIAWLVGVYRGQLYAEPRLQTKKGSTFGRGKPIALERLAAPAEAGLPMSSSDEAIAAHIARGSGYRGQAECALEPGFCLAMVGHPYVFDLHNESLHYEVKRGEVRLRCVRSSDGSHRLSLEPPMDLDSSEAQFVKRNGAELIVYEVTNNLRKLSKLINNELSLPAEAGHQLQRLLPRLSALLPTSTNLDFACSSEVTRGETIPVLRIRPRAEALRLQCLVTPFGPSGNAYRPGEGDSYLAELRDGSSVHVQRDLLEERTRARTLFERIPSLREISDDFEWIAHGLSECLALVSELSELDASVSRVEWPEGEPLKLRRVESMRISIQGGDANRWFEADGSVRLSDNAELRIVELLEKLRRTEGRFVRLSKDDYLELTQSTIDHLRLFEAFRVGNWEGDSLRLVPWLALALPEDSVQHAGADGARSWLAWHRRVASVSKLEPALAPGFVGELRDYQVAGFQWLVRMATLRTGVCLADDMGLGKTIQTLALLLYRATRSLNDDEAARPMLVVAPASVCPGWVTEAARFAPELDVRWLTGSARSLDDLTRRTVIVCTYEILHRDRVPLTAVEWDTVVLDEAHHIKNAHTHRARAACALRSDFRLATTGTPLENHLGELWSLYRFLMPGLLGDQHQFVERFRSPIENEHDVTARGLLQSLVRPFLLRRTKRQVASELPARTEMVRQVELSRAELELYEAVRLRGLAALADEAEDRNQQRVRVLAELMRLRRVCCHPKLVLKDSEIPSSKLAALLDLVEELRQSGHRALVFSQFVDHLSLVRDALDDQGVVYQYLDGATPVADRSRRVDAFQSGAGDLFLISLRAGGTGLNLTGADYVIHLDPWWNPAVEDQASDRAHRIGQERPVTIYRLVARGTIEERLVRMHGEKRSLVADVLEGSERNAQLDPDGLMNLLREASVSMLEGVTTGEYAVHTYSE